MDDIQQILNAMMRTALNPQTAAVAIAVIGLNIHFGYTGLLNIGQSAFMLHRRLRLRDLDRAGLEPGRGGDRGAARSRSCSRSSSACRR